MKILAGLGNPGEKYSSMKHNFGFWVLDCFTERRSLTYQAGKGDYLLAKKEELVCVKPTTYMNNSGRALLDIKHFFKSNLEDFLIIYDDIDLPLGTIRFRKNGGAGGHKGLESIIYQLQSENFNRLRLGIATEEEMRPSEKFVLSPFLKKDERLKNEVIEKACDGISYYLLNGIKKTMNEFNEKIQERN